MFKYLNLSANIFLKHSDNQNYFTRNNNKFTAPKCNMKKSEKFMNFQKFGSFQLIFVHRSDSLSGKILLKGLSGKYWW